MSILISDWFAVKSIISRDSFCAAEVDIFRAVWAWSKANPGENIQSILQEIRLELVTIQDLLKVVRPTEMIQADILLDAIQSRTELRDTDLRYRGYKVQVTYYFTNYLKVVESKIICIRCPGRMSLFLGRELQSWLVKSNLRCWTVTARIMTWREASAGEYSPLIGYTETF